CPWDQGTCTYAAAGGFFGILSSAVAEGCPLDSESWVWAAETGDLRMVKWLREHDCPWDLVHDGGPCSAAARRGHLEAKTASSKILKWLRGQGCP
ncbi:unnamed protein product, partial [Ectocarpus fasciculatus]